MSSIDISAVIKKGLSSQTIAASIKASNTSVEVFAGYLGVVPPYAQGLVDGRINTRRLPADMLVRLANFCESNDLSKVEEQSAEHFVAHPKGCDRTGGGGPRPCCAI
jgi:hypothetical protein